METNRPSVAIVGGGLAGMSVALALAERGFQVSIFEASTRLGGKAGADTHGDSLDDHGYHIFPVWYLNIWRLVDHLGIRKNFVDIPGFAQLGAGEFPRFLILENVTSFRYAWKNINSGFLRPAEMALFFYSTLDLMSQQYKYRAALDQVTVTGFLRSRFYGTETLALQYQALLLKGISVPSYVVSAMTVRNVVRYWARYPIPVVRVLRGDLQRLFIEPFQRRLEERGCTIHLNHRLEKIEARDAEVVGLRFRDLSNDTIVERGVEELVLAIPPERVVELLDNELYAAAPSLSRMHSLRSQPMAALNVYLRTKI